MTYIMEMKGIEYEMGLNVKAIEPGDVIKIAPGKLEVIFNIEPLGKSDKKITTESGNIYDTTKMHEYGKKVEYRE